MVYRAGSILLLSLALFSGSARAQVACGDLDADGDVDAADALILRNALSAASLLTPYQQLRCDVISETLAPGRCSIADAVVMSRTGLTLDPGVDPICPEGASAACNDAVDEDGDGYSGYPNDPGCASPNDDDETDDCPNGPNCPVCANGQDDDFDGDIDYPLDAGCSAASDTSELTP